MALFYLQFFFFFDDLGWSQVAEWRGVLSQAVWYNCLSFRKCVVATGRIELIQARGIPLQSDEDVFRAQLGLSRFGSRL